MGIEQGTLLFIPLFVYGVFWILQHCDNVAVDPREPPLVRSRIPFFGHFIGLLRYGTDYYVQLHTRISLPAYTLGLLTQKVYVVNSLPLISAVHRNSRTLRFDPLVKLAAERLSGLDSEKLKAFDDDEEKKRDNLSTATLKGIARALSPGPDVDKLNLRMLSSLQSLLNEAKDSQEPRNLLSWIQHVITQASTDAIYGPANPFADQKTEDAFWTFEKHAAPMLLGIAPRLIARKASLARDELAQSMLHYYGTNGHKHGSSLARARMAAPLNHNLTLHDVAKLEVPFLIAILANTVPATFWLLTHIYSRPALLSSIRSELGNAVVTTTTTTSSSSSSPALQIHTLSLSLLKTACPLLLSTYHETLRLHSALPLVRAITTDTVLPSSVLLKAGAWVMIPSNVVHASPSTYASPSSFSPSRWIPKPNADTDHTNPTYPRPPATAFRAFGGAPNLCPGRHFATSEILAAVATTVLRYEIEPEGGGEWAVPAQDLSVFAAVPPPKRDLRVVVRERVTGEWAFGMGAGEGEGEDGAKGRWGLACG